MKLIKEQNKPLSNEVSDKEAEEAYIKILKWIGEDPNREGLLETPKRVLKAYGEWFKGYEEEHTKFRGTSKKDQFDSTVDGSWLDRWDN